MVKLVYTLALGAGPFGGGGSSPLLGTLDFCAKIVLYLYIETWLLDSKVLTTILAKEAI